MKPLNRRQFVTRSLLAGGAAAAGALGLSRRGETQNAPPAQPPAQPSNQPPLRPAPASLSALPRLSAPQSPTDRVRLGQTGIVTSLVGIGTGSSGWGGGSNQTRQGQNDFTRLMRHAYDKGITLFDLADQYGSNVPFGVAMQGVQRESYVIQTKSTSRDADGARADIDRFLRELKTDYIDSLIVHCVTEGDWNLRFRGVLEVFEEAKAAGKIRSHGVTCHSYRALRAAAQEPWVDLHMVRWNAAASHMDGPVERVRPLFAGLRERGLGMIGMKVVGQGDLLRGQKFSPQECFRFQIESGIVDSFVVGVESTRQIDELISGTQTALREVGYRFSPA